ncbi:glutathione S-transferase family protein [Sneathiella marina]|uniref:Glutathione S-transferase family protein n=1 Tax=Sneathiella marina TaxID=2950108 RepID=A0ABY4W518_9PROT|nr:glutathione S-transferase family protein [Sneathiella marina]USG60992.1 glutathione S-transferase family protein [Sneathiella marina]
MKLFGSFSSPYVRRVAITLRFYGLEHELQKLTPFGEEKEFLRKINPLGRVPVLQLDDGECISESHVIIEYLDSLVDEDQRLTPVSGKARREVLSLAGVASATADKLVTILYEYHFRPREIVYKPWIKMCEQQVEDGFIWLNSKLRPGSFFGDELTQADISAAVFWRFAGEKRPEFCKRMKCDNLQSLSNRLEQNDAFKQTRSEGPLPKELELGLRADRVVT